MLSALLSACNAIKEAEEVRERWAKKINQFYPEQDISEFYSPTKRKKPRAETALSYWLNPVQLAHVDGLARV